MHLSGVVPVQESHPSGHFVMAAVSNIKYFEKAIIQSAKVIPKQTAQLVTLTIMVEIAVVFDKVTVMVSIFPIHLLLNSQIKWLVYMKSNYQLLKV